MLSVACQKETIGQPDSLPDVTYGNHPQNTAYTQGLMRYQQSTTAPGTVLLVKRKGEDVWIGAAGHANLEYQTPMRTNHQFRTGSITKMLTAVIMLQLVQENRIHLEDKIAAILPGLATHIDNSHAITVRHLLGHLSGIPDPPNESLHYQADILNHPHAMARMTVNEKIKKYISGKKLKFSPGTGYSYSNANYWLLGAMAEKITGKTLPVIMRERIFVPLQMDKSALDLQDDRNVARGYVDFYRNGKLMDVTIYDKAEGDGEADGGLISTAADLYRFMKGLFDGELLSPSLLNEMKRQQLASCNTPECEYGLGIEIWRTGAGIAYGHNGSLLGMEANVLYYPDVQAFTVLYKNNGNFSDKTFLDALIKP